MFTNEWTDVRLFGKITFSPGVAAPVTHVDLVWKWLSASGTLMKVGPFSTKRIRRNNSL